MPELKRNFSAAKMNKDMDERLVPNGQYRDALNIQIATSDGSDVGAAQNILGNTIINDMALVYNSDPKYPGSTSINAFYGLPLFQNASGSNSVGTGTCVGSIAAADKDKIYYFISAGGINYQPGWLDLMPLDIKKDFIIEYDTVTERLKYVFVDIYHVKADAAHTTANSNYVYINDLTSPSNINPTITNYSNLPIGSSVNITGVRTGMSVHGTFSDIATGNPVDVTINDGIFVTDLEYEASNNRWKVYISKPLTVLGPQTIGGITTTGAVIKFSAPRVLNFNENNIITGINIIDDMLFWTDNHTEPKKINIQRSLAGTGGVEYLVGANAGAPGGFIFGGDTPFFHTRLVTDKREKGLMRVEMNGTKAVWVEEKHITVIKKAPTQPLELEMSRQKNPRFPTGSTVANLAYSSLSAFSFLNPASGAVYTSGETVTNVTFDQAMDFRVGDILLLTNDLGFETSTSFDEFEIRAEVSVSPVTNPDNLSAGPFELRILSISTNVTVDPSTWFVRIEDDDPLFEFKFVRFSYRYKYTDGEYSTFAPWSQVAFLPDTYEYFPKKGYNLGMRNQLRGLKLSRYFTTPDITYPEDITEIDILYKETNSPTVYTVKTITPRDAHPLWPDNSNYPTARGECEIKTDLIHAVVPSNQLLRPWDNVPRKALGQEVSANRIIYGNYLQNYTVASDPLITLQHDKDESWENWSEYAVPSVKTMRTYQIGVVFSDGYGRETPVLTNKDASIYIPKDASTSRNRILAKLEPNTQIPSWAKYFSWYLKETSNEYYTLAMDRWYHAADGNIWISFPSSERNKLDEETFLILKKAHGEPTAVFDKARYKILAIENEAPNFIKTEKKSLGVLINDLTANNGQGTIGQTGGGNNGRGYPLRNTTEILIDQNAFNTEFGPNLAITTPDSMYVKLYGAPGNTAQQTREYEVTSCFLDSGYYVLKIKDMLEEDVDFTSSNGTFAGRINNLRIEIIEHEVENKPEFDGRFFVKIYKDTVLDQHILSRVAVQTQMAVDASYTIRYLNNCYTRLHQPGIFGHADNVGQGYDLGWGSRQGNMTFQNNGGATSPSSAALHPHAIGDGGQLAGGRDDYSHHTQFWWGNGSGRFDTASNRWGVTTADAHYNSMWRINWNITSGEQFCRGAASTQSFFIDDCSAFSLDGRNQAGYVYSSFNGNANDPWGASWGGNAYDAPDGETNDCPVNVNSNMGQVSRGIWNGGSFMDIMWTGFGDGWDSNWNRGKPYDHRIGELGGTYDAPAAFINRLVEPGTQFWFQRDPGRTIYTVVGWRHWPEEGVAHPHGNVYRSNPPMPTSKYTGIWGIRNTRTGGTGGGRDKNQYVGYNMRQRWTIEVDPPIGSTGTGYRPDKGTRQSYDSLNPGNLTRPLRHDGSDFDTISIVVPVTQINTQLDTFTDDPGIWETEPKETTDVDIYYQASPLIPLELNKRTNEEYLPIDSYFLTRTSPNTRHYITDWIETDDGQTIEFTPAIPANNADGTPNPQYLEDEDDLLFVKRIHHGLSGKVDATDAAQTSPAGNVAFGPGDTNIKIYGGPNTNLWALRMYARYQVLDWNNCWVFGNGVESDRIRDDFNANQMDNGVKASTILAEPIREERRKHGLIWSGIYNSIGGINDTNQFIAAEKITKDLNPEYGSIQKLYSRDTDLLTLCEDKCLTILSNKDALFNADGNSNVTATSKVLGAARAYQGDYGISTNPESFAATPSDIYFVDQMRGKVLNMAGDNHVRPISDLGMKDYFADNLKAYTDKILGTFDEKKNEYNITIMKRYDRNQTVSDRTTLSYSEKAKGWTSFKSFKPENGLSLNNEYYTFQGGEIFKHHSGTTYNTFYGDPFISTVTLVFNDIPESVKSFNAINYEGTRAKVDQFISDTVTDGSIAANTFTVNDNEYFNLIDKTGWYVNDIITNKQEGEVIEFKEKEGKWFGLMSGGRQGDVLDPSEFSVQGLGTATVDFGSNAPSGTSTGPTPAPTTITVRNLPSHLGTWDSTPDDTFQSSTNPYTTWTVNDAGIYSIAGATISSTVVNLTIDNVINGVNTGLYLRARDFSIGPGVPTNPGVFVTGSGWEYTGTLLNADPEVTKVVLSDNGQVGTPNNTVNVAVHLDSFTIQSDGTLGSNRTSISIDIDHVPGTGGGPGPNNQVSFTTVSPVNSNQLPPVLTTIPNITSNQITINYGSRRR